MRPMKTVAADFHNVRRMGAWSDYAKRWALNNTLIPVFRVRYLPHTETYPPQKG